jgi:hypothetical protein
VQEDYIKDEQKNLKREYLHAQEEVKRIQSVPLVIGRRLPFSPPSAHIQNNSAKLRDSIALQLCWLLSCFVQTVRPSQGVEHNSFVMAADAFLGGC